LKPDSRGQLVSLATGSDRTLYFDFLPVKLPKLRGYAIRVQMYTVPGQVHYNSTRKLVLAGADGVGFVADSQGEGAAAHGGGLAGGARRRQRGEPREPLRELGGTGAAPRPDAARAPVEQARRFGCSAGRRDGGELESLPRTGVRDGGHHRQGDLRDAEGDHHA